MGTETADDYLECVPEDYDEESAEMTPVVMGYKKNQKDTYLFYKNDEGKTIKYGKSGTGNNEKYWIQYPSDTGLKLYDIIWLSEKPNGGTGTDGKITSVFHGYVEFSAASDGTGTKYRFQNPNPEIKQQSKTIHELILERYERAKKNPLSGVFLGLFIGVLLIKTSKYAWDAYHKK